MFRVPPSKAPFGLTTLIVILATFIVGTSFAQHLLYDVELVNGWASAQHGPTPNFKAGNAIEIHVHIQNAGEYTIQPGEIWAVIPATPGVRIQTLLGGKYFDSRGQEVNNPGLGATAHFTVGKPIAPGGHTTIQAYAIVFNDDNGPPELNRTVHLINEDGVIVGTPAGRLSASQSSHANATSLLN